MNAFVRCHISISLIHESKILTRNQNDFKRRNSSLDTFLNLSGHRLFIYKRSLIDNYRQY